MLARADLVTYSGPHWSTFGIKHHFEPTLQSFVDCLFRDEPITLRPSEYWSDELDQEERKLKPNEGWWLLGSGQAAGQLVGGNLCTLNLLQGTSFMPPLDGTVLFVEDDLESKPHHFGRNLTSLLQQSDAAGVRGLLIGRFKRESGMTRELLQQIVATNTHLEGLPILANLDFGHTDPLITLPVGGHVEVEADAVSGRAAIRVVRH
jgi:muramoyltetrapeptide carboxypeptidase